MATKNAKTQAKKATKKPALAALTAKKKAPAKAPAKVEKKAPAKATKKPALAALTQKKEGKATKTSKEVTTTKVSKEPKKSAKDVLKKAGNGKKIDTEKHTSLLKNLSDEDARFYKRFKVDAYTRKTEEGEVVHCASFLGAEHLEFMYFQDADPDAADTARGVASALVEAVREIVNERIKLAKEKWEADKE